MPNVWQLRQPRLSRGAFLTSADEERGGPMETYYKESSGPQSFKIGDLVYLDANGTVALATVTSHKQNSPILGIAQQAAAGITGNQVRVRVIKPWEVYVMNIFHTTIASSATVQTMQQPNVPFGIYMDTAAAPTGTGGIWTVDNINTTPETGGTLARVQIVGFQLSPDLEILNSTTGAYLTPGVGSYASPAIGDYFAPVLVKFLPISIQDGTAHQYVLQGGW